MPTPSDSSPDPAQIQAFIDRWHESGGHERGTAQQFILELCQLLEVETPRPAPPEIEAREYCFERGIPRVDTLTGKETTVRIDCYKRGHFVLETKQGINPDETPEELKRVKDRLDQRQAKTTKPRGHGIRGTRGWDKEMQKAKGQAEGYVRDLPASEGRPPFIVVCDVGYMFELYAEFSLTGGRYVRFPDPKSHRIYLEDLADPAKLDLLRTLWTDPLSLDPSKRAAAVTREISDYLATLAQSMEADGHSSQSTALFLQRCLFTMFAEDVGLLPANGFLDLLLKLKDNPAAAPQFLTTLWKEMATGTPTSLLLFQEIAYFNGGLFEDVHVDDITKPQIELLIAAAKTDWSNVEPAIFGTLLERALSPNERHKLGAHYTPRSYVERLVKPTIIDPLRKQWDDIMLEAAKFQEEGKTDKAIAAVHEFHHELCRIRILDPACGSGNFLYVTLEHMKRLEGEVIELLQQLGDSELTFEMEEFKVRPQQFLGLEINERAVAIAQLVLWIGYFQWHKRATGSADTNDRPLIPKARTIVQQDAVLAYDDCQPSKDAHGNFVCIWDGRTTKPHPVTGKEVPNETATKPVYDYLNPRRATWPDADYIVGNPPFIGTSRMRDLLGDGYTEALRKVWKGDVPESADFVMFWWQKAAELVRDGKAKRFGFITTNSIHQTFNRRVLEPHLANEKKPLHLAYAIPDHPWVDSADGAAVRIAMTVATTGQGEGQLEAVIAEHELPDGEHGVTLSSKSGLVVPNLKIGANVSSSSSLLANTKISCPGVKLHGSGFIVTAEDAIKLGSSTSKEVNNRIKEYRNGKDLTSISRGVKLIDLFGLDENQAKDKVPSLYQWLLNRVKPDRDAKAHTKDGAAYAKLWWLPGKPRQELRSAISNIPRYIATVETSKHRFFTFLDQSILPDNMLVNIATDDALFLGALSSSIHVKWALASGGTLEDRPRYNKTRCFETFPFPSLEEGELKNRIRELGEQLDAHRKARQAEHADLTMTGMYNVLEKLRKEEPFTEKDKKIHNDGLVTLLKQYHDNIDDAVLQAYGWQDLATSTPIADRLARGDEELEQQILTRLVALNHERAAEEKRGLIRYLRPEYQNPNYQAEHTEQDDLAIEAQTAQPAAKTKLKWPKQVREQGALLKQLLPTIGPNTTCLSAQFGRKSAKREAEIQHLLKILSDLGQL
ncbi:DNA methyltransferase [Pelagicoccus sp. SDUM812002]|uniref:class I SAM-dependent DNA methyltransferase n=1 Tax=Pelagicoccus sp. SDUM812002 TaxID=3041266 RepID=UPI00280E3553|nr:DNA methyltransferase [Pelagicoccus sp. SDUM812002]MDQ8185708.1 hypothetical protein [Pelagicoccus sp. SDUM812002]